MINETRDMVLAALPHGSGLDMHWVEDEDARTANTAWFRGGWHFMDSHGYYGGWMDVRVRYYEHERLVKVPLRGPMEGQEQILHRPGDRDVDVEVFNDSMDQEEYDQEAAGVENYLEELVYQTLRDAGLIDVRHEVVEGGQV